MDPLTAGSVRRFLENLETIRKSGSTDSVSAQTARDEINTSIREADRATLLEIAKTDPWGKGFDRTLRDLESRKQILIAVAVGRGATKKVVYC